MDHVSTKLSDYLFLSQKYTGGTKKYGSTPFKHWIQMFSVPLSVEYKIKHLAMQSTFRNICERMGHSHWIQLSYCNRMSLLQQVGWWNFFPLTPQLTVSSITANWNPLGSTACKVMQRVVSCTKWGWSDNIHNMCKLTQ